MNTRKTVLINMLWRFAERCGAQGVTFIVSIVLARILAPSVYGIVALITVFTGILQLFIDSGFKNALIQKRDADQLDFSTVFYFNVFAGVVLYLIMFALAPLIAGYYQKDFMTPYIRVLSLTLVLGGVNGVQQALVMKRMIFKRFFYATLTGTVISAVVGIVMAYNGMGVWAVIAQMLTNQFIDTVFLWFTVKWRPSLQFSFARLKPMFRYGSRLLASALFNNLTINLTNLLVGKVYTEESLAYYTKSSNIPSIVVTNLHSAVQSVLFPVLADRQTDKAQLKAILNKSIMVSAYLIFPCMVGLGICAEQVVRILFTDKWIAMVPYLRLWCIVYGFTLLHTANLQVIQATGRSDIFLKIEVVKQLLTLVAMLVTIRISPLVMLAASVVIDLVCYIINAHPNKKLADYGALEQIKDILPVLTLNIVMGICVYIVGLLNLPDIALLAVRVLTGIAVYVVGSMLFKFEIFGFILSTIKELRRR